MDERDWMYHLTPDPAAESRERKTKPKAQANRNGRRAPESLPSLKDLIPARGGALKLALAGRTLVALRRDLTADEVAWAVPRLRALASTKDPRVRGWALKNFQVIGLQIPKADRARVGVLAAAALRDKDAGVQRQGLQVVIDYPECVPASRMGAAFGALLGLVENQNTMELAFAALAATFPYANPKERARWWSAYIMRMRHRFDWWIWSRSTGTAVLRASGDDAMSTAGRLLAQLVDEDARFLAYCPGEVLAAVLDFSDAEASRKLLWAALRFSLDRQGLVGPLGFGPHVHVALVPHFWRLSDHMVHWATARALELVADPAAEVRWTGMDTFQRLPNKRTEAQTDELRAILGKLAADPDRLVREMAESTLDLIQRQGQRVGA